MNNKLYKMCRVTSVKEDGREQTESFIDDKGSTQEEWYNFLNNLNGRWKRVTFHEDDKEDNTLLFIMKTTDGIDKATTSLDNIKKIIPEMLEENEEVTLEVYRNDTTDENFILSEEFGVFDTDFLLNELEEKLNNG